MLYVDPQSLVDSPSASVPATTAGLGEAIEPISGAGMGREGGLNPEVSAAAGVGATASTEATSMVQLPGAEDEQDFGGDAQQSERARHASRVDSPVPSLRPLASSSSGSSIVAAENTPNMPPYAEVQVPPPLSSPASRLECYGGKDDTQDTSSRPLLQASRASSQQQAPHAQHHEEEGQAVRVRGHIEWSPAVRELYHVPENACLEHDRAAAQSPQGGSLEALDGGVVNGDTEDPPGGLPEEMLELYDELSGDAKAFAARMIANGSRGGGGDGCGGVVGSAGGCEQAYEGDSALLTDAAVEVWIRDQMLREGRTLEEIERERELVREGREGERGDVNKDGRGLGGPASPVGALAGDCEGALDKRSSIRTEEEAGGSEFGARAQVLPGREGEGEGEGGLWWGAKEWDLEAADDTWCDSERIFLGLVQLLRTDVCLYGQLFAARALAALASRTSCRGDIVLNSELISAVSGALRSLTKIIVSGTAAVRVEGSDGGCDSGEGAGSRRAPAGAGQGAEGDKNRERDGAVDKMEARRLEQRSLVGLGGALHLCLGILKVARLGPATRQIMVAAGVVPALCDTLAIRVTNPGGPRLHEVMIHVQVSSK